MDQRTGAPRSLPVQANHQKREQKLKNGAWPDRDNSQLAIADGRLGNLVATAKKSAIGHRDGKPPALHDAPIATDGCPEASLRIQPA